MPVSKRLRYEILKRDNHACRYCGQMAPDVKLTVDHVTPVALGGADLPDNLVAACQPCNSGKTSTTPNDSLVEDVRQTDLKWSSAVKRAADALGSEKDLELDYVCEFINAWPQYRTMPRGAEASVVNLYRSGLPAARMVEAVDIAMSQRGVYDRFSYFMGICWRRVTEIQETAKQILAEEEVRDAP